MDKTDKTYAITGKVYDLIYELNVISPRILLSVLPHLECKLKATQEAERLSEYKNISVFYVILLIIWLVLRYFIWLFIFKKLLEQLEKKSRSSCVI